MKKRIAIFFLLFASIACPDQVLHTKPDKKSYQRSSAFIECVEKVFQGAAAYESDADVLRAASDQVEIDGAYVELGTGMGRTTNFIAALNPEKKIFTFDSYQGHPADWDKGDRILAKDFYAWPEGEKLPHLLNNVVLIQGWFEDTLAAFVRSLEKPIAFLHVDCEIYESTAQALDLLEPKMVDGTVILFDEFYNYPNYRNHEYKAFKEFLEKYSFEAEYLAYNAFHEQAAVRIHRKKMVHLMPSEEEVHSLERTLAEFKSLTNEESFARAFQRIVEPIPGNPLEFYGSDQRIDLAPVLSKLVAKLPPNATVFDVGAGTGDVVDYALKNAPSGTTIHLEEPNPLLIKDYLQKLEKYPHLKKGSVYTGYLQDYYTKNASPPEKPLDLILAIHMIYHLTDFTAPSIDPEKDLIDALSFLYGRLAVGGSIFIVYASNPEGRAIENLSEEYFRSAHPRQPYADNLNAIYMARNKLLGPKGSIAAALAERFPHTKPTLHSELRSTHFYARSIADMAVIALAGELCPSDSELFDLSKIRFCWDRLIEHPERYGLRKETRAVSQKGLWRADEPQVIAMITKS